jgi:hypothetical protein
MPRYKLRTLLIVLALGPPLLAGAYWKWLEHWQRWACHNQILELGLDPKALSLAK